jgi:16S rRNA (guanine527-N7)-methyltransferase
MLFYKGEKVFDEVEEHLPHKVIITQNRHYLLIDKELK